MVNTERTFERCMRVLSKRFPNRSITMFLPVSLLGGLAATINTIGGLLKLQSLAAEGIDMMNGKLTIATQSN